MRINKGSQNSAGIMQCVRGISRTLLNLAMNRLRVILHRTCRKKITSEVCLSDNWGRRFSRSFCTSI